MICKVTENLRTEYVLKDSKYHVKYIYYHVKHQRSSALQKTKVETDFRETENINKQDFSLFTQVTTAFFSESDWDSATEPFAIALDPGTVVVF